MAETVGPIPTLVAAAGLALVHLFAGKLRFLGGVSRSRWLSIAGGVSVAYVFVHLLPELAQGQEAIRRAAGEGLTYLEHHAYLLALLGLVVFYGLERAAEASRRSRRQRGEPDATGPGVFWLHILVFAIYNAIVGYLLVREESPSLSALAYFTVALGLHFVVNDYGLREHHKEAYARLGRWLLATAILSGWAAGLLIELPALALAIPTAFLAGGIVLNVLKEELPAERESRFWAFGLGAGAYATLLLVVA